MNVGSEGRTSLVGVFYNRGDGYFSLKWKQLTEEKKKST